MGSALRLDDLDALVGGLDGHGYCSADADNWFFRSIFHPRDSGYAGEAVGLVEHARELGVVYPR